MPKPFMIKANKYEDKDDMDEECSPLTIKQ